MSGATLGKSVNRAIGTTAGGVLGFTSAFLVKNVEGVGKPIIIAIFVFIFGKYYICRSI